MNIDEPFLPPHEDIGLLCMVIANGFTESVLRRLASAGFDDAKTGHGFVVQGLLAGDTTVTQLAERLGVSAQAVSKTVQEMEALGYITKVRDPADGRSWNLELSPRAQDSIAVSRKARIAVQDELRMAIGRPDVERTTDLLQQLAGHFGGLEAMAKRRLRPGSP